MDRRLLLTGLLGVAGAAGISAVLPRQAMAAGPLAPAPQPESVLPDLGAPADEPEALSDLGAQPELGELEEGVQLAHSRRRRRRVRRWRNRCRWRRVNGRWRRRCRREPYWVWLWFWI